VKGLSQGVEQFFFGNMLVEGDQFDEGEQFDEGDQQGEGKGTEEN
jgi:hypothetical protein